MTIRPPKICMMLGRVVKERERSLDEEYFVNVGSGALISFLHGNKLHFSIEFL